MANFLQPNQESLTGFFEILDFQVALSAGSKKSKANFPGPLLLEVYAEKVGLCRTARTDEMVRRHAGSHIDLIDQACAGNSREIRFTGEALREAGRRGPGLDGYHRSL